MTYTVPPGRYSDVNSAFVQAYIDAAIAGVIDLAPETLNSLNELAAAINDDPAFYATVADQVAELNTDVTAVVAALGVAENDSDMGSFSAGVLPDASDLKAVLEAFAAAWQTAKDNIEAEATSLSGRLDTLEADPTTATAVTAGDAATLTSANTYTDTKIADVIDLSPATLDTLNELAAAIGDDADFIGTVNASIAAVQSDVDQNETDSDSADAALSGRLDTLEADPTTQTLLDAEATARGNADSALSGRLDTLEADPTTAAAVAAVQSDVDQNESDSDAADLALSNRLDVLEADPTTQTLLTAETNARSTADSLLSGRLDVLETDPTTAAAVAAVQADVDQNESDSDAAEAALSGRLDTLEVDPTTQTAVDAKLDIANPTATGQLTVDTNARLQFDSNLTKVENVLRGTTINIGNNIEMRPAAPGGRVEVVGGFHIDITEVPEFSNDTQAAAGGIVVGGIYRSGSVLHIRVS